MNERFCQMALVIALRKLLTDNHFSICDLDNCLALAGISISREERMPFQAIHCVDYSAMPNEFKAELAIQLRNIFSRQGFRFEISDILIKPAPEPVKTRGLLNWLKS